MSDQTIVPEWQCSLIMGSKVFSDLFGTISMYPRAGVVDVSTMPNTHTSLLGA